jgi:hypothetical protein
MAVLEFNAFYVQAANVASQPDPNTLVTPNPLIPTATQGGEVSGTWTTQAKKIIAATSDAVNRFCRVGIEPSVPSATYTIQFWTWNKVSAIWVKLGDPATSTGNDLFEVVNIGNEPVYMQIVALSSGTMDVSIGTKDFQVF